MRKSHSTASNLSDIATLKISSSQTSSNLNNILIPTNNLSGHDSQPNYNQCNNGNHIKTNRTFKTNYNNSNNNDGINYQQVHMNSNANPLNSHRLNSEYLDDNVITSVTTEEVDESHLKNNTNGNSYQNHQIHHHPYYHYNDSNCFSAIQEEKVPVNFVDDSNGQNINISSNNNNCLKIQNELLHQPSSSSSSSSLNNNSRGITNSNNNNCNKMLNYGSSISNTTTGK